MNTIITENLYKKIKQDVVLNNINLTLESGNIYGFVGRNGSGKSMLFRALSGLIKPTSGKIIVNGKELHKDVTCVERVGLVIENAGLYTEFTGYKNLEFLAKINNLIGKNEIKDAITRVGLNPDDKRSIKKYSLGMKQRIVIAQAIMEKPKFLFLDEPTNALDENGIDLIRTIIKEESKRGALVLLASHNKEDIDFLCDIKFNLKNGNLVLEESV